VLELQGALCFASAEIFKERLELGLDQADYCIVELKEAHEIDSTGARALSRATESAGQCGKHLLLSFHGEKYRALLTLQASSESSSVPFFTDTDEALEWAEDRILEESAAVSAVADEMSFEQTGAVVGFSGAEIEELRSELSAESYPKGSQVYCEGDAGRDLFILLRGRVTVRGRLASCDRSMRLQTLCPGSVFGEMALLDGKTRSADVWAEDDVEVLRLTYETFKELARRSPILFGKLTVNLAQVSTGNLRRTDGEMRLLE
jgi:CRP-like cAMP-binding protein/ABC-type transporter Mla MlaB component